MACIIGFLISVGVQNYRCISGTLAEMSGGYSTFQRWNSSTLTSDNDVKASAVARHTGLSYAGLFGYKPLAM